MAGFKEAALGCLAAAAVVGGCRGREPIGGIDLRQAFATAEHRSDTWDLVGACAGRRTECPGFSPLEGSGADRWMWMQARHAAIRVRVHSTVDKVLRFRVHAHPSLAAGLGLTVSWNGAPLGVFDLGAAPAEFVAVVPGSRQAQTDNVLEFDTPRIHIPSRGEGDPRRLVAAFSKIQLTLPGGEPRPSQPTISNGEVRLPSSTSVAYYARFHDGARLHVRGHAPGGDATLAVRIEDDQRMLASARETLGGSGRFTLPVATQPGSIVRLVLSNDGPTSLALTEARLSWPQEAPPRPARIDRRPNIIVYLVDTLRADALGPYGGAKDASPRFDSFARESLVFEDAGSQASWTRPSVASLFTGLTVSRHGVDRETRRLAESHVTLAERLSQAGYRTCALVANHLVDARFGFAQGFGSWNDGGTIVHDQPAADLVDGGLRCAAAGDGPFFVYIHAQEPHSPYEPSAASRALFEPRNYHGDKNTRALLRLGQLGSLAPDGLDFLKRRYRGEVRDADAAFGRLLDGLAKRSLLESTLVLFTSDHGEEFREHGGTEHAKTLYQELIRLPLAVRLPGMRPPGRRLSTPIDLIDLMPTLLALVGSTDAAGSSTGRDRSAEWLGHETRADDPIRLAEARFEATDKTSVRVARLKLIVNNDDPGLWRSGVQNELYDLGADPGEQTNLFRQRPVTAAFLLQRVEAVRLAAAREAAGDTSREVTLTPEDRDRLRALGYIN